MATAEVLRDLSPLNDAAQALDTMEFPASPPPMQARAAAPAPMSTSPPITIPGVGSFSDAASAINPLTSAHQQAKQREAEQMRIRANAMRPEYASIRTAADEQQRVASQIPQAPMLTPPPSRGLRDFLEVSEGESPVASIAKLMQSLSLFTNVAVGGSRHNAMGALAAFAGAMKGWQEGDAMRADRGFKDWEAQTAQALKQYDLQRTQYNDALTAAGKNYDGRIQLAKIKALELGDEQAIAAFESGSLDDMLKFLAGRQDKRDDLQLKSDTLIQARADARTKAEQWLATFLAGRDDAGARERQALTTASETGRHNRATEMQAAETARGAAEERALRRQEREDKREIGAKLPASQGETLAGLRAFTKQLDYVAGVYDPTYVGPAKDWYRWAKSKAVGLPDKEEDFRATIANFENTLLKLRSGAAVTDQEFNRIKRELPQTNDPPSKFAAKLAVAKRLTEEAIAAREQEFKSLGYRVGMPQAGAPDGWKVELVK